MLRQMYYLLEFHHFRADSLEGTHNQSMNSEYPKTLQMMHDYA
jgi:hypothetical protein